MGTFIGHAIPSIVYTLIGIWWGFSTAIKYISSTKNRNSKFIGTSTMSCFYCPTRYLRLFPFESFLKLIFLSIHFLMEILTTNWPYFFDNGNYHPIPMESVHHMCMISGFIFGSIVEILIYYGAPFPNRTEYACNMIAFLIQTILMSGKHNDVRLEFHVHYLWSLLIYLTFISACLEAYNPDCFWFVYARIYFFMTQGTWLMQSAYVIWPHTKNPNYIWGTDHESNSWLDICLMYHLLGVATFLLVQYLFVNYTFNSIYKLYKNYELDLKNDNGKLALKNSIQNNEIEYSMLLNEDEA